MSLTKVSPIALKSFVLFIISTSWSLKRPEDTRFSKREDSLLSSC